MKSEATQQMVAQSSERVQKFVSSIHNSSYVNSVNNGSIPLLHPDLHEFVDRSHQKPIYIKNYKPAGQRAADSQQDFLNGHLPPGPYYKLDVEKRTEDLAKEKHPMRYGLRTENERLQKLLMERTSALDHCPKDTRMVHWPNWKSTQRSKWMSGQTFKSEAGNFSQKSAWGVMALRHPEDNQIFLEREDEFKRKSHPTKSPFNPVIKKNPYTLYSDSIRTGKQDEAFGLSQKCLFSQNEKLKHYKKALVITKSLDHLLPYNHSNNFQAVKNIFPDLNKQYIKTAEQMNLKLEVQPYEKILEDLKSQKETSFIQERPTHLEKTTYKDSKSQRNRYIPYTDEESKSIVSRYFDS